MIDITGREIQVNDFVLYEHTVYKVSKAHANRVILFNTLNTEFGTGNGTSILIISDFTDELITSRFNNIDHDAYDVRTMELVEAEIVKKKAASDSAKIKRAINKNVSLGNVVFLSDGLYLYLGQHTNGFLGKERYGQDATTLNHVYLQLLSVWSVGSDTFNNMTIDELVNYIDSHDNSISLYLSYSKGKKGPDFKLNGIMSLGQLNTVISKASTNRWNASSIGDVRTLVEKVGL